LKTLSAIRKDLQAIVDSYNYTGPAIDSLVQLLSRGIYENEINIVNLVLESSFFRSKLLNSKITHAFDRNYSVFRGENQKLIINDLIIIKETVVKKFDILMTVGKYKLVYANDYSFIKDENGDLPIDRKSIECYLCIDVANETITVNDSTRLINYSTSKDISEIISVSVNDVEVGITNNLVDAMTSTVTSDGVTLRHLNNLIDYTSGESLSIDSSFRLLIQTISDYGIAIINTNTDGNKFSSGDIINIKYIPYTEDEITLSQIKSIPGYETSTTLDIEFVYPIKRVTDPTQIYVEATTNYISNYVIRSNSDLLSLIKNYFNKYMYGLNLTKEFMTGYIGNLPILGRTNVLKHHFNIKIYSDSGRLTLVDELITTDPADRANLKIYDYPTSNWISFPEVGLDNVYHNRNILFKISNVITESTEYYLDVTVTNSSTSYNYLANYKYESLLNTVVYYIKKDNITSSSITTFLNYLSVVYKINDINIIFIESDVTNFNINIVIAYKKDALFNEVTSNVTSLLDSTEKVVGGIFDPYSLISAIQAVSGVSYVKINNYAEFINIDLLNSGHINFTRTISYVQSGS